MNTIQLILERVIDAHHLLVKRDATPQQVQSMLSTIEWWLKLCGQDGLNETNLSQLAYICATAHGEANWIPQKEKRDRIGGNVRAMQDRYWPSGYYGRGLVQLTWLRNYQKFSKMLGIDLVSNPDAVLDTEVSARILVHGMVNGSFTGWSLNMYISDTKVDFLSARRIINGTFKAHEFKVMADEYREQLITLDTRP
jgi:Chitinase class I